MSNTTYITAPTVGLGNKSDESIKWQDGSLVSYSGELTPDLGSTQLWKNDVTWGITRNSNKFINDDNAFTISGEKIGFIHAYFCLLLILLATYLFELEN